LNFKSSSRFSALTRIYVFFSKTHVGSLTKIKEIPHHHQRQQQQHHSRGIVPEDEQRREKKLKLKNNMERMCEQKS
jgi:hypothetical protein